MKKVRLLLATGFLWWTTYAQSFPCDIVKPFNPKTSKNSIDGIDAIVFINLDKRIEKKTAALNQFANYDIIPNRFPAINGWTLNQQDLDSSTQLYAHGMASGRWACILNANNGAKEHVYLNNSCLGKNVCSVFLTHGALGCFLSQLSLIKNAYDNNLQTIWILEDDFKIVKDPRIMSKMVSLLNQKIGSSNWDILFTDLDTRDANIYYGKNDFIHTLTGLDLAWLWRPDFVPNVKKLSERTVIDENFIKIGSRMRNHSFIVNRVGMKKIIDFYSNHGIFSPIDHEIHTIPNINNYSLLYDIVTFEETVSDTRSIP
jgi:GR25 family glycosyltransferase involved in LPS biosynthesis